jgi:hypothetical protein
LPQLASQQQVPELIQHTDGWQVHMPTEFQVIAADRTNEHVEQLLL